MTRRIFLVLALVLSLIRSSEAAIATVASNCFVLGVNGGTTTALNLTGATNITVIASHNGGTPPTIADSSSNTWPAVSVTGASGGGNQVVLWSLDAPTVSSAQTVTLTLSSGNVAACIIGLSSTATAPSIDQTASNGSLFNGTVAAGSVTPGHNNERIITGAGWAGGGPNIASIDAGFTLADQVAPGAFNFGVGWAYFDQSTAGAKNPTFTFDSATTYQMAVTATIQSGAGGGGGGSAPMSKMLTGAGK